MVNFLLLLSSLAFGAVSTSDRALIERGDNLLKNGGFESGKSNFTASGGTFAVTTTAANIGKGSVSGSWNSNGAAQTLTSTAVAIPAGLYGRNGVASCIIQGAGATHTLQAYDGTNILASQTITSQAEYARTSVNFIFPSSGNISLRLVSVAADEPTVYVDDCYLGPADTFNLSQVSQASLVGRLTWSPTTNCQWNGTSTSFADLAADADCDDNARTSTGIISDGGSPSGQTPAFTITNGPPGEYFVVVSGSMGSNASGATTAVGSDVRLYDGTTVYGPPMINGGSCSGASGTLVCTGPGYSFPFSFSGGTKTIKLQYKVAGTAGQFRIFVGEQGLQFSVYRFPSSSEIAYRPDVVNRTGQVKHAAAASCRWTTTSASFASFSADADCTTPTGIGSGSAPGTKIPAGVFTNIPAGKYKVFASGAFVSEYAASSTGCNFRLYDGTNSISEFDAYTTSTSGYEFLSSSEGIVQYSANQTSLTIEVQAKRPSGGGSCSVDTASSQLVIGLIPIDQNVPMPNLVGSVLSNSSGVERVERARLNCDGSSVITSQSGSWITSIGNISSGTCAITFATGIFTAPPSCVYSGDQGGANEVFTTTVATSTTGVTVKLQTTAYGGTTWANSAGYDFQIICMGPK